MLHSTYVDGVDVDIIFFLPHVSLDGAEVWAALRGAVAPLSQYIASVVCSLRSEHSLSINSATSVSSQARYNPTSARLYR